jgi:hypothetical protein
LHNVTFQANELANVTMIPSISMQFSDVLRVRIPQTIQLDSRSLAFLIKSLQAGALAARPTDRISHVYIDRVLINSTESSNQSLIVSPLEFTLSPSDNGASLAKIKFKIPGDATQTQYEFTLENDQDTLLPNQTLYADTGNGFLPSWLIHEIVPNMPDFGPSASISGAAKMAQHSGKWTGEIQGAIKSATLDALTENFPAPISGIANLAFQCVVERNKFSRLDCKMVAQHGELNTAWNRVLKFETSSEVDSPTSDPLAYHRLFTEFSIANNRIYFIDSAESPGLLITNEQGDTLISSIGHQSLPLQDSLHRLTLESPEQLLAEFDPRDLNNTGVELLHHFQLDPIPPASIRTAEQPPARRHQ